MAKRKQSKPAAQTQPMTEQIRAAIAAAMAAGRTQSSIAQEAGMAPIVLSRIASGARGMKLETAEKIAQALGKQLVLT